MLQVIVVRRPKVKILLRIMLAFITSTTQRMFYMQVRIDHSYSTLHDAYLTYS